MNDLEIEAILATTSVDEKTILNWSTTSDKYDGDIEGQQLDPDNRAGIITWNKNHITKLTSLEPDEGGTIDFKIKILDYDDLPENQLTSFVIKNTIRIKVGGMGETNESYEVQSNPITLSINTNLNLQAYGRYYDEQKNPIGSGPVPPQIDKTTNYKIYWNLSNALQGVTGVKVSATLPEGVIWENKTDISAGELTYNQSTDEVTWQINKIPAGVSDLTAEFEIHITPTEEQLGKILDLTEKINLEATNQETDTTINQTLPAVTTNLDSDPLAEGKGMVIGPGE